MVWYLTSRHRDTMTFRGLPDPKGAPVRTGGKAPVTRRRSRVRTRAPENLADDLIPLPVCVRCPECLLVQWIDRAKLGMLRGQRYWTRAPGDVVGGTAERERYYRNRYFRFGGMPLSLKRQ